MSVSTNVAPVIIKRKKVVAGGGHHGGAWKVAYADFVTAMMAFFLLMWLLNATTEKQRKGIADYFSPTIPISRVSGGGDGDFGGDSVFSEETLPQNGTGATKMRPTEGRQARGEMGINDSSTERQAEQLAEDAETQERFDQIEEALLGRGGESSVSKDAQRHIVTRVTDEGLIIELFDIETATLFDAETDVATPLLEDLAKLISDVSQLVKNQVAIEGYIRSVPIVVKDNPVWNLSIARADRMRKLLEAHDLSGHRVERVTGHADRDPVVENRLSFRNNRLEVIFLRNN